MKTVLIILLVPVLFSCSDNSSGVKTETKTDTITNVTNPGVGTASDDTGTTN